MIPYSRPKRSETIPFTAAHTYMAHIWQYPHPRGSAVSFQSLLRENWQGGGPALAFVGMLPCRSLLNSCILSDEYTHWILQSWSYYVNTTPKEPKAELCFWFFRCRVDVLQINFHVVRSALQNSVYWVFYRSCVCSIFVCGPLQF